VSTGRRRGAGAPRRAARGASAEWWASAGWCAAPGWGAAVRWCAAVGWCAALALACGCGARPAGRSIVVITLDTTRADHLSAWGYPARTSPAIDALAARGILCEQAFAPMPQTLPSHATMFTGLQPRSHGALENHYVLPEEVQTLAELLAGRGYDTAACIAAAVLDRSTGMAQGFLSFDEPQGVARSEQHPVERRGDAVTDAALAWALSRRDADRPFLLWAHYYDPHGPFEAPVSAVPLAPVEARVQALAPCFEDVEGGLSAVAQLWWEYDNELAYADGQVQRLLDGLAAQGLLEDTVIAVVGDHGEGLHQHGQKHHGVTLHEEVMRVPFVLVAPDGELAGTRLARPVSLADLAPSLLTLAGLAPMPGARDGEDLLAALRAGRSDDGARVQPVFSERPHYSREWLARRGTARKSYEWGIVAAVRVGDDKLIRDTDGSCRLYDLAADPHELYDLSAAPAAAGTVARLSRALDDWIAAHPAPEPGADAHSDAERDQALRQLGY
jgi:arylsulfatase A-like enzyme